MGIERAADGKHNFKLAAFFLKIKIKFSQRYIVDMNGVACNIRRFCMQSDQKGDRLPFATAPKVIWALLANCKLSRNCKWLCHHITIPKDLHKQIALKPCGGFLHRFFLSDCGMFVITQTSLQKHNSSLNSKKLLTSAFMVFLQKIFNLTVNRI